MCWLATFAAAGATGNQAAAAAAGAAGAAAAARSAAAAASGAAAKNAPAAASVPGASADGGPHEWTRFRLTPQNNVVIPGPARPRWTVETGAQISASPAIVDHRLFLGNNAGLLVALDVQSGRQLWSYQATSALMSNPLVYHGLVIVGEGNEISTDLGHGRVRVGNGPSGLIAVDENTGALRWRFDTVGSAMPTPAIVGGSLIDHDGAGIIVALNPLTGDLLWSRDVSSVASMVGMLPLRGDTLVTNGVYPNAVFAINPVDGSTRWTYELPPTVSGVGDCPPASDGRNVFGDYVEPIDPTIMGEAGVTARMRVYALDGGTGAVLWNVPLETGVVPQRNESAIPLVSGNNVFVGSAMNKIVTALDTWTGAERWKLTVGGPVKGGMVEADGVLYFGDLAGFLWAVDEPTGHVIGALKIDTRFNVGSPVVYGQSLIVGTNTGRILAIPLADIRAGNDRPTGDEVMPVMPPMPAATH